MLADILPGEAFAFLLILTRIVFLVMFMPALGENLIPRNIRVFLALTLAVVIYPMTKPLLPPIPNSVIAMALLFLGEILIGSILALAARFLMSAVHTAGTIIAFQSGLASAQSFDPSQGTQSAMVAAFFNILAVTLIFVMNLHHLMIMGFANSYIMFPVGEAIAFADFAGLVTHFTASSFHLGVQIAAPFIVYAFVFNLSMGLIARLLPQFQVFFVGLPVNIYLAFTLMMIIIGSIMVTFLQHFEALLLQLVG